MIERLAIIDHITHKLYIEDVDIEVLEKKYNGEEEAFLADAYGFKEGDYSWDYITEAAYMSAESLEFSDIIFNP